MRLTVLGSSGGVPAADQACSGYLVEHDGFLLLLDVGYAVVPALLRYRSAVDVDAVFVSHGHPDHCADLNPLLRLRTFADQPPPRLPVYALPGALDAVLALDRPGLLDDALDLVEIEPGRPLSIGPFEVSTRSLPHSVPNAGIRLSAGGRSMVYTGDAGPSPDLVELAADADLLLAEATEVDEITRDAVGQLSSAREAGEQAAAAGVGSLLLTHLWPGTDHDDAVSSAARAFGGDIGVAVAGLEVDV